MITLAELANVIPDAARDAWPHVAAVAPADAALLGGTALAVWLQHRVSRDLDVFTLDEFDPDHIEKELRARGPFATTRKERGTLNGVFNGTKVQFLWAINQTQLEEPTIIDGLPVGAISDIYATKLNAVAGRGELRDYFDLMCIEAQTGRPIEEGVALFMTRYGVDRTHDVVGHVVEALGYLDDLEDDPYLTDEFGPELRDEVTAFWTRRQPQLVRNFDTDPSPTADLLAARALADYRARNTATPTTKIKRCTGRLASGKRCRYNALRGSDRCGIHSG